MVCLTLETLRFCEIKLAHKAVFCIQACFVWIPLYLLYTYVGKQPQGGYFL